MNDEGFVHIEFISSFNKVKNLYNYVFVSCFIDIFTCTYFVLFSLLVLICVVSLYLHFYQLKALTSNAQLILDSLRDSDIIEVQVFLIII